jgi:ribonucleoside-diphosphate reductase alpha chain
MKFARLFSKPDQPVAEQIEWKTVEIKVPATGETQSVEVPAWWSDNAAMILVRNYLRKAGVPDKVTARTSGELNIRQDSMPGWLWPCKPMQKATFGSETSARQVFHRMAGCWTYWGWRSGVFGKLRVDMRSGFGFGPDVDLVDSFNSPEENARIFHDECYMMLAKQIGAPNSPQWFNTGLHWAYGIEGPASGQWAVAELNGGRSDAPEYDSMFPGGFGLMETTNSYERPQPHACFIQPVSDDLVNPGGIMDLWLREVRLFKYGSGTGTNFSRVRGRGEPLSGGGKSSGLMSFLRIGDRAAGSIKSGGTTRRAAKMVIVDADHPEVEDFIDWKAKEEYKAAAMFVGSQVMQDHYQAVDDLTTPGIVIPDAMLDRMRMPNSTKPEILGVNFEGEAIDTVGGQNSNNSVRVTDEFMKLATGEYTDSSPWQLKARTDGSVVKSLKASDLWDRICRAAWACADPGLQFHDIINEWHTCPNDGEINASNPCSEYMFLDDTACNLASLNLVSFLDSSGTGEIDLNAFEHATRIWTVVLDISVTMASFPSKEIALGSYNYRTLGLGYANLGGLLMRRAVPYDSDEGRTLAASLTALMHFTAYQTSNEMAKELGPFPRWEANKDPMAIVLLNHYSALMELEKKTVLFDTVSLIVKRTKEVALSIEADKGYRNAQTTLLAPTGTIHLIMDCDTSGIEPDFALVKDKNLAGGGTMKIVNQSIEPALLRLKYDNQQRGMILAYIEGRGEVDKKVPMFDAHRSIFTTANDIRPMAHVEMVAAVQPFLSGAVSKTINMPNNATVEDVSHVYRRSWELKLKAVALYRDGCKLAQPLSASKPKEEKPYLVKAMDDISTGMTNRMEQEGNLQHYDWDKILKRGQHEYLPWRREKGYTQKAKIGDSTLFWRVSEYDDGRPGEVFIELAHEGSTLRAMANCVAIAISIGLQHGTPLEQLVDKFLHTKFEPDGIVEGHDKIKFASSIADLIAKDLAITYLGWDHLAQVAGTVEPVLRSVGAAVTPRTTGDPCPECGSLLIRTGTCRTCPRCSYNEGCG